MNTDPIVSEVRAAREQIFAECDYDLDRFNSKMKAFGEQLKSEGWAVADRPIMKLKSNTKGAELAPLQQ
jgi:hypothetical protein